MEKWNHLNILVVEDDADNLEFLRCLLSKYGADVFLAKNAKKALEYIISKPQIQIVLMDIRLPDMDGLKATQKIKAIRPDIPIIAQTAYAMYNDRDLCLANGCDDYISKPLSKDLLFDKINKYIYV